MQRLLDSASSETLDEMWDRLMVAEGIMTVATLAQPNGACCCPAGFTDADGVRYNVTDAGCKVHGRKSMYIPSLSTLDLRQAGRRHLAGREE